MLKISPALSFLIAFLIAIVRKKRSAGFITSGPLLPEGITLKLFGKMLV